MDRRAAVRRGIECGAMLYDVGRRNDEQLYWVYDLAAMAPDGIAVECGVHHGGSLVCWAAAREGRGEIVAVDSKFREAFHQNLALVGLTPRIIEANSWDAPGLIGRPVAFCFIDACHGPEGISRDVAAWPDAVMPGGILAFHDYTAPKSPAVQEYVDAWQAKARWEPLDLIGSLIAFRRPE